MSSLDSAILFFLVRQRSPCYVNLHCARRGRGPVRRPRRSVCKPSIRSNLAGYVLAFDTGGARPTGVCVKRHVEVNCKRKERVLCQSNCDSMAIVQPTRQLFQSIRWESRKFARDCTVVVLVYVPLRVLKIK